MAKKVIKVNLLSVSSIRNLKEELIEYRDSLDTKLWYFVKDLLEQGIATAQAVIAENDDHQLSKRIVFDKRIEIHEDGCRGILMASGEKLYSRWYRSDGQGGVEEVGGVLNALLAAEFGTAAYALPPQTRFGGYGGQGTNSQYGHSSETQWWIATSVTDDGKLTGWKAGTAIRPSRPLHNALLKMEQEIENTARRYF